MESRLKVVSVMLLVALVLSLAPAATMATPVSAAACYHAQFVADVTVPDGATYNPGAIFQKTWKLRNIGECAWNGVTLVFDSGTQMGTTASVPITSSVNPGQNVDVSVDLTAPSAAGHYRGYWKLKGDPGGIIFGIGRNASSPFWVDINVKGTPTTSVVYDFAANAGSATWENGAGIISPPITDGDVRGYWLTGLDWKYEDGASPKPAILVAPQNITNGSIKGAFPAFKVQTGDVFKTQVGCELPATSCYVQFSLAYKIGTASPITIWRFNEKWDQRTRPSDKVYPDIKLDALAGKDVIFILSMSANGSPTGDRALWGNPVIVRKGIIPPTVTGTPPTATPSKTPGPITVTVPPSACDKVKFVKDETIPDGTVVQPGATFIKTWSLKNVGSCPWTTSYQMVFFSGEQMGAPASSAFSQNVAVGDTFKFSLTMTAPSVAGAYRGYWMFKNANGALFGFGPQGNQAWWVLIKVAGPTVTPGGPTKTPTPTVTPGGPTVTPSANIAYDFAVNACATGTSWSSGAGALSCPGSDGDAKGFVLKVTNPKLESGAANSQPGILTFPQNTQDGKIQGIFPEFPVKSGDRFKSIINCENGATNCYVAFRVDYQIGTDPIQKLFGPFRERYEGQFYPVDIDLSLLAGKNVKFILTVLAAGTAAGDRALWIGPHIYRPGGSSALPDLTITQMKIELQNTSCLEQGASLGARIWVTNSGQASAGSFNVKVGDAQQSVSGLAVGETKPVFFASYSNPVTAVVDSGSAVAESNEQNNSRTENVPVPTAPLPCAGTSTPTSTVTATATATATTAAASAYQNVKYNFKFTLPSGASIISQSDNKGRVNLPIITSGTNLLEKYIEVNVADGVNPCKAPDNGSPPLTSVNETINNIQFLKETGSGAAAGNRYDWTAYSTMRNNGCISLTFILHSANPGNYATPPPVFDSAGESAVITTIMNTFNWITP